MSIRSSNKLIIIASVISLFLLVIYLTTDLIQQVKQQFEVTFLNKKIKHVTYYQWTDQHGEMIISQTKPSNNQSYITFQASNNLIGNENIIDKELIKQGKEYRQIINAEGERRVFEREKKKSTLSKNSPLNAISKTKTCITLSFQLAEANRNGQDISMLKKQYSDEC